MAGRRCFSGRREQPRSQKQHVQRGEDRPAGRLGHGLDGEGDVAGRLAARGVDEAQGGPVGQQADGNVRFAQQPLEARLGAGVPAGAFLRRRPVEVGAGRQGLHQHDPGGHAVVARAHSGTANVGRSVSW